MVDVGGGAAAGVQPRDDVEARGVDVEDLDGRAPPGQLQLDRGEPEGAGPPRERTPAAGLVDDDAGAPAVVEDADERRHGAERGPRGDRVPGRPRQAEQAGDLDRLDRLGVDGEQVRGPQLLGQVDRAQPQDGVAPGAQPGDGGPDAAERPDRDDRRLRLVVRVGRGRGERLQGPDVVRPRTGEVGLAHLLGQPVGRTRLGEAAQGGDQGLGIGRRHEQAVDAVADLAGEGADRGREDRPAVPLGEEDVLRGGRREVRQDDHVVAGHQPGDPVGRHVAAVHLDPAAQPRVGGQLADAAAGIPPQLAGHGERDVVDLAEGLEEQVDALVVAHDAEGEQPHRAVVGGAWLRRAAGQVRRQVDLAHPLGAELGGEAGLLVGVDEHGVGPTEQCAHERSVPGPGLVGQHVVGDDDHPRAATTARPGRPQQREVGGHHGRHDVDDDDDVELAQPPAGPQPGVGARPRQDAQGAREGLDVGSAARHRLLTRVEERRVEVAPGDERDVVAGLGQLVRQRRRVRRHPALERVRRADERDPQGRVRPAGGRLPRIGHGVRHRPWTARRGRRAAPARRS